MKKGVPRPSGVMLGLSWYECNEIWPYDLRFGDAKCLADYTTHRLDAPAADQGIKVGLVKSPASRFFRTG